MKKLILCCLLAATIILTGCAKDQPIDPLVFVGKWFGFTENRIIPGSSGRDTIILVLNPNNSTQLIDTFNNRKTIYTVTEFNKYIKADVKTSYILNNTFAAVTITDIKGVLTTDPNIIIESRVAIIKFGDRVENSSSSGSTTYVKQK